MRSCTEELVGEGETLEPAGISKIFRVQWPDASNTSRFIDHVEALIGVAKQGRSEETLRHLHHVVPTFNRVAPTFTPPAAPSQAQPVGAPVRRRARPVRLFPTNLSQA